MVKMNYFRLGSVLDVSDEINQLHHVCNVMFTLVFLLFIKTKGSIQLIYSK